MSETKGSTSLGEVVEIIMGQAPPSKECNREGAGTPFVKVGEFGELRPFFKHWTTKPLRMAQKTDVLLCVVGATCGKINLGEECAIGRSVAAIRPDTSRLDQMYLYYFMSTLVLRLRSNSVGAAQTVISKVMINGVSIPLPPLSEQKRIVAILDEAFVAIDRAKEIAEKNLANAKELFESYLNRVFSEKGEGWEERTIEDLCRIGDGNHSSKYPKKSEMVESGIPFIRGTNIVDGKLSHDAVLYITEEKHQTLKKGHLETGDVLFTNRGEIGKVAIVDSSFNGANLNSQIAWLRCRNELENEYLFFFLQSGKMRRHYASMKTGAALQQFTIKMLRAVEIAYPATKTQQEIVNQLRSVAVEAKCLKTIYEAKLTNLDELKQSILQKAFTGQLTANSPELEAVP